MKTVALVIHETRIAGQTVTVYADESRAITAARGTVTQYDRWNDRRDTLNGDMRRLGFVYHETYGEADTVAVQVATVIE